MVFGFPDANVLHGIAIIGTLLCTVIGVICWNIRRSRCTSIELCGGLIRCDRKLMTIAEINVDGG
jgi:hypothetical protein